MGTTKDYREGFAAASKEIVDDRWSRELATDFLDTTSPLEGDFDRGFRAAVEALAHGGKVCRSCPTVHTASAFDALPIVGRMDDVDRVLVLRNCGCGSTLALPEREIARAS
jgi:hypothetical protein